MSNQIKTLFFKTPLKELQFAYLNEMLNQDYVNGGKRSSQSFLLNGEQLLQKLHFEVH